MRHVAELHAFQLDLTMTARRFAMIIGSVLALYLYDYIYIFQCMRRYLMILNARRGAMGVLQFPEWLISHGKHALSRKQPIQRV